MKWFLDLFKTKPLLAILLIIIILVLIYIAYKVISGAIANAKQAKNYNTAVTNAQTQLTSLATQGIKPSMPQANFDGLANSLQTTFSGCGLDWKGVVVPTFQQMKNDADVYALISAYGVRTFDECGWGSFTGDLHAALTYKTSGIILTITNPADIFTVASIASINEILKQNGLNYQF